MGILAKILGSFSSGPPIQNLKTIGMVLKMKDGGLFLIIATSKHLDSSEETLNLLRKKVENYVKTISLEEFKVDYPNAEYFLIEIKCVDVPAYEVINEVEELKKKYNIEITFND